MKLLRSGHFYIVIALFLALIPWRAVAADVAASGDSGSSVAADPKPSKGSKPAVIRSLKAEIEQLRKEDEIKRKMIEALAHRVDQLEAEQQQSEQKREAQQKQHEAQIETAVANQVQQQLSTSTMSGFMDQYLGLHRLVITGSGQLAYEWNRGGSTFNTFLNRNNDASFHPGVNTFGAQFEPIFLYRLNDWILFESEIEAKLPDDAESEFNLEMAMAHLFLTDYLEVQIGKWFVPFGDFIEDVHPFWVNRFVTMPLPFREGDDGALVPFADLGLQLRGAFQWGAEGQDLDYAAFVSNGPTYGLTDPPVTGGMFSSPNNIALQSHSKAWGGRLRIYPLPLDAHIGRLELGASTYDGQWLSDQWFTSWGVSAAYLYNNFEARGEYLQTHRDMPSGQNADNREGWYIQFGYQLSQLGIPYLNRMEPVIRYSGQNQRAFVMDELPGAPSGNGGDLSLSTFMPHSREVALGLDYWISPSIVWKVEYDIELPRNGGFLMAGDGTVVSPINSRTGMFSAPNDRSLVTALAVGF